MFFVQDLFIFGETASKTHVLLQICIFILAIHLICRFSVCNPALCQIFSFIFAIIIMSSCIIFRVRVAAPCKNTNVFPSVPIGKMHKIPEKGSA